MQGQNRSVTIIAAFLMEMMQKTLKEAMAMIRAVRPNVCPFRDNREVLVRYEADRYHVSTMTMDDFIVQHAIVTGKNLNIFSFPAATTTTIQLGSSKDHSYAFASSTAEEEKASTSSPLLSTSIADWTSFANSGQTQQSSSSSFASLDDWTSSGKINLSQTQFVYQVDTPSSSNSKLNCCTIL